MTFKSPIHKLNHSSSQSEERYRQLTIVGLVLLMLFPFDYFSPVSSYAGAYTSVTEQDLPVLPDDRQPLANDSTEFLDVEVALPVEMPDTTRVEVRADDYPYGLDGKIVFNPSPQRAVWLSALLPGLGQIYNRRYWKLPIVIGGFMGLAYATSWNNSQYRDYMQGYRDITDSDPNTNSYMGFFPPTVNEADLNKQWLEATFKSRKDYFRRNRDLCIICLVALYLVCMLDAYVDASMAHFDISPSLSLDLAPTMVVEPVTKKPSLGLSWALTF